MPVAIDFGTSRTKLAYWDKATKKVELLHLGYFPFIPSSVYISKDRSIIFGDEAEEMFFDDPKGAVRNLKRNLKEEYFLYREKEWEPVDLLTGLFMHLRQHCLTIPQYNDGAPETVVLTHPAEATAKEENILREAAERAGFKDVELLPEPEAAAIDWLDNSPAEESVDEVLVLDCGGGTVDWACVRKARDMPHINVPELPRSNLILGGLDLDEKLLELLKKGAKKEEVVNNIENRRAFFLGKVRRMKESFSGIGGEGIKSIQVAGHKIGISSKDIQTVLSKFYIEKLTGKDAAFRNNIERYKEMRDGKSPIILLVGGSSKIKGLRPAIEKECKCKVIEYQFGDFAVVRGAIRSLKNKSQSSAMPDQISNSIGMKFKLIQSGEFLMSSRVDEVKREFDEHPRHKVALTKSFYMGVYAVTQKEYEVVMGKNPSYFKGDNKPVENVTWNEAIEFCKKLTSLEKKTGKLKARERYCLPTEAQWEYCCRAGTEAAYYWGEEINSDYLWYNGNSRSETHDVGEKEPNAWGLYDMSGNVWEWCFDWYGSDYYKGGAMTDPNGPASGAFRVLRGGSWGCVLVYYCRTSNRSHCAPGYQCNQNGFRVVRITSDISEKMGLNEKLEEAIFEQRLEDAFVNSVQMLEYAEGNEVTKIEEDILMFMLKINDMKSLAARIKPIVKKLRRNIGSNLLDFLHGDICSSEENITEAIALFLKGVNTDYTHVQNYIGICYEYGNGVQKNDTAAVRWYRLAADQRHAEAQNNLGVCYANGEGVQKDFTEAVRWYRKAADQGYALSQYMLGECYENGTGVQQNSTEAVKWYRKAAEQGLAPAQYSLGVCYENGTGVQRNCNEAVKWYRLAADQGNVYAQYNLGGCYKKGNGVRQNYNEAVKWYRLAADQGDANAQNSLGLCCYHGIGVQQDYNEAVRWFRLAADQGDANVQDNLGNCCFYGQGVQQNYNDAVKWYRLAADQGNTNAQKSLGLCYANGNGVQQNYNEAVKWYRKAADQGLAEAQYNLGCCYDNGNGVQQNLKEAVKWFRLAADQEYAPAQYMLGVCYDKGNGVQLNYNEAARWYRLAADQGLANAQYMLGLYKFNESVLKDLEFDLIEAAKWFRLAAEQGKASAQFHLGLCCQNGIGVQKNYAEAIRWYRKAATQGDTDAQNKVGWSYFYGEGVQKDLTEAVRLYRLAADQGYADAQYMLGLYKFNESVLKDLEFDLIEAAKWFRLAAEQGKASAQFHLGLCCQNGIGVQKNYAEAIRWYRKAATQGNTDAQCNLGFCYETGVGVQKDLTETVHWFRLAADQGDAQAQYNLGLCYANGIGVQQNCNEAVKWYQKAADQEYAPAQYNLGVCCENGTGVQKNDTEAVRWYRLASDQGHAKARYNLGVCYDTGVGVQKDLAEAERLYCLAATQGIGLVFEGDQEGAIGFEYPSDWQIMELDDTQHSRKGLDMELQLQKGP